MPKLSRLITRSSFLALLTVLVVSAQAASSPAHGLRHQTAVHAEGLETAGAQAAASDREARCPLCVAAQAFAAPPEGQAAPLVFRPVVRAEAPVPIDRGRSACRVPGARAPPSIA
ncbi:MAG TPA: hypothetical protein VM598_06020 [Bdellovibrionota bacterium]|nr:hypothetical protein [Bdellovibrionota bacterium]